MIETRVGDCLDLMRAMPDASVDAIVTDPPDGLQFMGQAWDRDVPSAAVWREACRVLKPGGHVLAFAGTRTQHRMATRIEDGGFEIRDLIAWVYSTGFPKSLDVGKAIDKAAGAAREPGEPKAYAGGHVQRSTASIGFGGSDPAADRRLDSAPATPDAATWEGWGTALKPAMEPITVARKSLAGTVAGNVLAHGTGALNIDGARIAGAKTPAPVGQFVGSRIGPQRHNGARDGSADHLGRWPANLIHDGSDEVVAGFPQADSRPAKVLNRRASTGFGGTNTQQIGLPGPINDTGSAARFFYCAKPTAAERGAFNDHPTVKPIALMRYLCRLVTPPSGLILDPFGGSGTTGVAAAQEGFDAILCEIDPHHADTIDRRLDHHLGLFVERRRAHVDAWPYTVPHSESRAREDAPE